MHILDDSRSDILNRPLEERCREHKYRFAQSLVFGLPVIALQYAGPLLGGLESPRWIGLFQALLAGWVVYVGATGMLVEGLMLLSRRRWSADGVIAALAAGLYLASLVGWGGIIVRGTALLMTPKFHLAVLLLIAWTGMQAARLSRKS